MKLEWKYVWMYHYCSTLGCTFSWCYTSSGLPSNGTKDHEVQPTSVTGSVLKKRIKNPYCFSSGSSGRIEHLTWKTAGNDCRSECRQTSARWVPWLLQTNWNGCKWTLVNSFYRVVNMKLVNSSTKSSWEISTAFRIRGSQWRSVTKDHQQQYVQDSSIGCQNHAYSSLGR